MARQLKVKGGRISQESLQDLLSIFMRISEKSGNEERRRAEQLKGLKRIRTLDRC